jgi:thymidylate synthase (FAD)
VSLDQCGSCGLVAADLSAHFCTQRLAHQLKNVYFPVLDEGFVALKDFMGSDEAVVEAARVSYAAGTKKTSDDRTLLRHLFRHKHSGPFEMCELKFHVKLPVFVARQLIRHRTASLNEMSLRYSLAPLLFYLPEFEVFRKQSATNRQGRGAAADREVYDRLVGLWRACRETESEVYQEALVEDIARELARIDLPLSLYTEWYWKIDLRNFFHFMGLRADSHAQHEIQVYANMKGAIARVPLPRIVRGVHRLPVRCGHLLAHGERRPPWPLVRRAARRRRHRQPVLCPRDDEA